LSAQIEANIRRRRTFAIISHPDAGKTTLTEKILLYAGAIHLAGSIKSRRADRHVSSDWMAIERERGISVTSSVLQFGYEGYQCNLLDTPGHADFGEDTYRTLLAADSAIMLLDNAKGIEARTRKLFDVCRLRRIPVVTFVNKCDREGMDPLTLLSSVEQELRIGTVAMNWPMRTARAFAGVYDRERNEAHLFSGGQHGTAIADETTLPGDDPGLAELLGERQLSDLRGALELLDAAGDAFDPERFLAGDQTPVFFGSAATNFGVRPFLRRFVDLAPRPSDRSTRSGATRPAVAAGFSGFVFKIQANMDPSHRDRLAFVRICSGRFARGMSVRVSGAERPVRLGAAFQVLGRDRIAVEEAFAGDVLGLVDTNRIYRIGDTLSETEAEPFAPVPRFAPEVFATVRPAEPIRRRQMVDGLRQLAEEGAVQLFQRRDQGPIDPIVAAVGALQLDVLKHRLEHEYGTEVRVEPIGFSHARWVVGPEDQLRRVGGMHVEDDEGRPVVLLQDDWALGWAERQHPDVRFLATSPADALAGRAEVTRA
jgi:peptide chain release factor 3